jgi:hypothetical protein
VDGLVPHRGCSFLEGLASGSNHGGGSDRCQTIFNAFSFFGPSQRAENLRFAGQSADNLRAVCAELFFEHCEELAIARLQLVRLAPFVVESADVEKRHEYIYAVAAE